MTASDVAIATARSVIGKPYSINPHAPDSFDCSLLIQWSFDKAGVKLPRTTFSQIFVGSPVSKENLLPGDLVFPSSGHVQIYTGGGNIVEAATVGQPVIERKMWGFWQARRVAEPGTGNTSAVGTQTILNPATDILNLWNYVRRLGDIADQADRIATAASNPKTWLRVFIFIAGALLIAVAIAVLSTGRTSNGAT